MWKISTNNKKTFLQAEGQTLLDAASNVGISLPYSCKTGRCNTCKCQVSRGKSTAMFEELGLTTEEKAKGYILICVRSATSDMLIDIEDFGDQVFPEIKILPARISSIEKLAANVLGVSIRFPSNTQFTFLAGQFIEVMCPIGIKRSYSLANAHKPDNQIQLHIRAVHNGAMSDYWFKQAKVNDLLRIIGPFGSFFARPLAGLHLVFLGTGTGIAPLKAMLEKLAHAPAVDQPLSATLYWGGREVQDLYTSPNQWYPLLRYVPVLSRASDSWNGTRGYVQKAFISDLPDLKSTVVYACGSNIMVQSAKAELTELGLPEKRFYSEVFVPSGSQP